MQDKLQFLLNLSLQKGADEAEIYASEVSGFTTTVRNQKKEQLEKHKEKSYHLTVYKDNKSASINSSDFSKKGLDWACQKAISLIDLSQPDSGIELAPKNLIAKNIQPPQLNYKTELSIDEAFDLAMMSEKSLLNTKDNIRSDSAEFTKIESESYLLNSHNLNYHNKKTSYSISAAAIAEDNKSMEIEYDFDSKIDFNDLDKPEKIGNSAAKKALRKLESQKINTIKAPVIFSNEVSNSLISHYLSALSGNAQYHQQSFYLNDLNKKVFPEFINIKEIPLIDKSAYSKAIDSEGLAKKEQYFIENGVIKNYLLSHYTATKLKMEHTANAGGSSNTVVYYENQPSFADLINQMNEGLIITSLMGSSINPNTGNYSRGASGFWVKNGMIQFPVKEITIAGNLKQMAKNIVAIARDIDVRNSIRVGSILIEQMSIAGN